MVTGNKKDGIIALRTICEHPKQKKKEEEEEDIKRWSRRVLCMRHWYS
jgi:hypothetical protein